MVHPTPNCLVRNRNPAFRQQILDIAKAQSEPEIQPDRLLNDLRRESVSVVADFLHRLGDAEASRPIIGSRKINDLGNPMTPLSPSKIAYSWRV
jgi:hypothetical protein